MSEKTFKNEFIHISYYYNCGDNDALFTLMYLINYL